MPKSKPLLITEKPKGINMGQLQADLVQARSHRRAADTVLQRAQEARDRAVEAEETARRAFCDGQRAVLG